jgi:hypothetical protein
MSSHYKGEKVAYDGVRHPIHLELANMHDTDDSEHRQLNNVLTVSLQNEERHFTRVPVLGNASSFSAPTAAQNPKTRRGAIKHGDSSSASAARRSVLNKLYCTIETKEDENLLGLQT